jgi:hypothetical protein
MYQLTSAVVLILALVPFVASQLRVAIYPQLEPQNRVFQVGGFAAEQPATLMDMEADGFREQLS